MTVGAEKRALPRQLKETIGILILPGGLNKC